jgi:hypothetical protein
VQAVVQRETLLKVYYAQMKQMDKEGAKVNFSDRFTLDTLIQNGENWINFVD